MVVKEVGAWCDDERQRFGVRVLFALVVRVVMSDVERLRIEDLGLELGTTDFCVCRDTD